MKVANLVLVKEIRRKVDEFHNFKCGSSSEESKKLNFEYSVQIRALEA